MIIFFSQVFPEAQKLYENCRFYRLFLCLKNPTWLKVFVFQATLTKPPTDDDFEVEGLLGLPAAGGGGKKRGSADTTATGLATNLSFYI